LDKDSSQEYGTDTCAEHVVIIRAALLD
jgi:hypothetical protein